MKCQGKEGEKCELSSSLLLLQRPPTRPPLPQLSAQALLPPTPAFVSLSRYFRSGAPPVINPLGMHFPRDTAVPGSFALTLTWTLPNRTTGVFNITSPLPGDWFLAAHLPKEQGKISVKGLAEDCQYLFQPQLIVQRLVGIGVLHPGYETDHVLSPHNRSLLYK
ncbi:Transmembrane protein 8A, partial [Ophiophagus hannah]